MSALITDPHAALIPGQKLTIAQEVKIQLAGDYPPGAVAWVDDLAWTGPVRVALDRIDQSSGDTNWNDARKNKPKIASFATRIRAGVRKPVVLVRAPGVKLLRAIDGHTRVLACAAIGEPVTAWVGTAKTAHGAWDVMHARQADPPGLANDADGIDLAEPERVPPGRPEGGQFAPRPAVLTRYATPQQTAAVINGMEGPQRAMCRRSVMAPAGYGWAPDDRLAEAS
jgi:hypothetical protein